jgi:predicted membrane channel-forming protein YqfA (hemolysin III family)
MYLFVQADWPTLSLSSGGIFSISTFALSLLLVFRTNSSYEVRAGDMHLCRHACADHCVDTLLVASSMCKSMLTMHWLDELSIYTRYLKCACECDWCLLYVSVCQPDLAWGLQQ